MSDSNGTSPDAPSCSTCDFMRHEGAAMRCYYEPPQPALIGTKPTAIAGGPPMLVIAGLSPEVHPARFCRHHPLLEGRRNSVMGVVEPGPPEQLSPGYKEEPKN